MTIEISFCKYEYIIMISDSRMTFFSDGYENTKNGEKFCLLKDQKVIFQTYGTLASKDNSDLITLVQRAIIENDNPNRLDKTAEAVKKCLNDNYFFNTHNYMGIQMGGYKGNDLSHLDISNFESCSWNNKLQEVINPKNIFNINKPDKYHDFIIGCSDINLSNTLIPMMTCRASLIDQFEWWSHQLAHNDYDDSLDIQKEEEFNLSFFTSNIFQYIAAAKIYNFELKLDWPINIVSINDKFQIKKKIITNSQYSQIF